MTEASREADDTSVEDLIELLDLERIEENLYRGHSPDVTRQRVFGCQVVGQPLRTAYRPVEGRHGHSLHGYYSWTGDPKVPTHYEVDHSRDGKSITTRRVGAIQQGKQIYELSASFQVPETG